MLRNFPNPFNPETTITFELPKPGDISLRVFDLLGRELVTLQSGWAQSGPHSVTFVAGELPSGVYVYQLTTPDGSRSQKMILTR